MSRLALLVTILALLGALAWFSWRLLETPAEESTNAARPAELVTEDPRHEPLDAPDAAEATRSREVVDAGASADSEPSETEAALGPPGELSVQVLEGGTGRPLPKAAVHVLGETRFARKQTDAEGRVDLDLSPAEYELGVQLAGYERVRLGPVQIRSGEREELPAVALWPGSGHIEGQLSAHGVRRDRPFLVELRGEGRNPCASCRERFRPEGPALANDPNGVSKLPVPGRLVQLGDGKNASFSLSLEGMTEWASVERPEPPAPSPSTESDEEPRSLIPESTCPHCGYDERLSCFEVWPGGSFRFENLCAGRYRLMARRDRKSVALAEELLEIEAGASRHVSLHARETTTVEFELRGPDELPFDGNWLEEGGDEGPQWQRSGIQYRFHGSGRSVATARVAAVDRPDAKATPRSFSISFSEFIVGDPQRSDRERQEGDGLWPETGDPDAPGAKLVAERLRDNAHRILELPCRSLELEVVCGPWRSGRLRLDLESAVAQPVVVFLARHDPEELSGVVHGSDGVVEFHGLQLMDFDGGDVEGN